MDHSTANALSSCVSSLRTSTSLLSASITTLESGISDYPRLTKVLATTKHFELVSEPSLTTAQAALLSEIQPEVAQLLQRTELYLDKLARREGSLIAKAELQEGRLERPGVKSGGAEGVGKGGLTAAEEKRLLALRGKRDRLRLAVSRLEMQAGQRQRQLRKSMAAQ